MTIITKTMIINADKDVGEESLLTAGKSISWYSHSGSQHGGYLKKKLKLELQYDSANSLLSIYPKDFKSTQHRDTFIALFISASFPVARKWNQSRCPSAENAIKKIWCILLCNCFLQIETFSLAERRLIKLRK